MAAHRPDGSRGYQLMSLCALSQETFEGRLRRGVSTRPAARVRRPATQDETRAPAPHGGQRSNERVREHDQEQQRSSPPTGPPGLDIRFV